MLYKKLCEKFCSLYETDFCEHCNTKLVFNSVYGTSASHESKPEIKDNDDGKKKRV